MATFFIKIIHNTNSLLAIAHAQYHVTYLQGVDINHIFETRDPYLSMALRRRLTSGIPQNSVQPVLKAKQLTAHVPYHVTHRWGSKITTYLESLTQFVYSL